MKIRNGSAVGVLVLVIVLAIAIAALLDGWHAAASVAAWILMVGFMLTGFVLLAQYNRARKRGLIPPGGGLAVVTCFALSCMTAALACLAIIQPDPHQPAGLIPTAAVAAVVLFTLGIGTRTVAIRAYRYRLISGRAQAQNSAREGQR